MNLCIAVKCVFKLRGEAFDNMREHTCKQALAHPLISENEASNKNIQGRVSEQLKKNFRWRNVYFATAAIKQMKRLALNSGSTI